VSAKFGYNASEKEGTGVKTTKLGLGGEYALSKRTYLYTTVGRTRVAGAPATTGFDVGVSHSF
jgi:predicted porin